jgi:(E)-4-hydroxy-3-methylbut-2-enyl-diphosphate synthase
MAWTLSLRGLAYPLHIGVTEAGEGEDGRIRSAVGIGALLETGLGDTIRVSLTGNPERELPTGKTLVKLYHGLNNVQPPAGITDDPFSYHARDYHDWGTISSRGVPVVILDAPVAMEFDSPGGQDPDIIFAESIKDATGFAEEQKIIVPYKIWEEQYSGTINVLPVFSKEEFVMATPKASSTILIGVDEKELASFLSNEVFSDNHVLVIDCSSSGRANYIRGIIANAEITGPVILRYDSPEVDIEKYQTEAAAILGPCFLEGWPNGIWLRGTLDRAAMLSTAFNILQASRVRTTKTEFISCPSCGRTHFDIEEVTKRIRERTGHLKHLKIAIMGCFVNGPGEMADADYGYIGAGRDKIHLYKQKEAVKKNIPTEKAVDELIQIIKTNKDWIEP